MTYLELITPGHLQIEKRLTPAPDPYDSDVFTAWPCWFLVDMNVVGSQQPSFNPQGQQQYRLRTLMSWVWELYVPEWVL